jgi:hypothetical protein
MRTLWRGFVKTIFWSYERGSWPYDVMVIAILIVVLATPRRWFHDQSPAEHSPDAADVGLVGQDADHGGMTFRVNALALPADKRVARSSPELERETHDILGRAAEPLKARTFQVQSIQPVMDPDGHVAAYDVAVRTTASQAP